jgi:hypothetical protein
MSLRCIFAYQTTKKMGTYTNKSTQETYLIKGVSSLEQAWSLAEFVCKRNNWNLFIDSVSRFENIIFIISIY